MSGALMNKVWDLFGMDSAEPEEYEEENVYDYEEEEEPRKGPGGPPKDDPDKYTKEQIQSGASDWQNKGGNPLEYVGTILNNDRYANSSGNNTKDMYDLTKKYLKNIDPNQR